MPVQRANHDPVAKGTKVLLEKGSHMANHMASMRAPRETVVPFSRETCENSREHAREPIDTAKTPFSRYLTDEGVTRGVATEVNV